MLGMNVVAVLVTAVVLFFLGWTWYSPMLFGDAWMKMMKFSKKDVEAMQKKGMKGMWKQMLGNFLSNLVLVAVLSYLLMLTGTVGVRASLSLAAVLWLGFFATTGLGMILWENKPWKLYFIHVGYSLVALFVSVLLLGLFA